MLDEQLSESARSGSRWEQLLANWTALFGLAAAAHRAYPQLTPAPAAAPSPAGADAAALASTPAAAAAASASASPALDLGSFLLDMWAVEDEPELQVEALAAYKPAGMPVAAWDVRVNEVVTAVDYLRAVTDGYAPAVAFSGEAALLHGSVQRGPVRCSAFCIVVHCMLIEHLPYMHCR